jgi:membrane-bound lytic murein transglycosylase MltF
VVGSREALAVLVLVLATWVAVVIPVSETPAGAAALPAVTSEAELEANSVLLKRWTGDLDGMRERRAIRALVPYNKTYFFFDGAQPRGITYEALKTFENFVNKKLESGLLRIQVVFIPVAGDELFTGLVEGRGDIAAGNLTITPERQAVVDFSDPLMQDVREIVITGPTAPRLARLEDLAGRQVHVRRSSSYYESLQVLSKRLQEAGRKAIVLREVDEHLEDEDILEMMNAGLLGITVVDQHKADFWVTVFHKIRAHRDLAVAVGGRIGWAFRKESPQLRALVDEFAVRHPPGSTLSNILLRRYLRDNKWVHNPMAQAELWRFRRSVGFFRKFSEQYGFDYLMVTAQAYQESRLDQNVRSAAGAVGVMQIKPSTAAAEPIGIQDIQRLEPNINAGVKYLRHITDEYFDDPGIDPVNRHLFAFAAYNAGPTRIDELRRKAATWGLDPNRWFGNVERVAARDIGRQTVQYVSNIYKYYIAYTMAAELEQARRPASGLGGKPGPKR